MLFVAALKEETLKITKRVPKGTSEYQAAWIVDSGDENDEDDEDDLVCAWIVLLFLRDVSIISVKMFSNICTLPQVDITAYHIVGCFVGMFFKLTFCAYK